MQTNNQKHINFRIIRYDSRFRCRCSYQVNREKNFNYIDFVHNRMHRFQVSVRMFNTIKNHSKKTFYDWYYVFKKSLWKTQNNRNQMNKWKNNSADVMIKKKFCDALKRFISTNIINAKTSKWIERTKSSNQFDTKSHEGFISFINQRKKSSNQFDTKIDEDFAFFINHHFLKIEFDSINLIQKSTKVLRFFINHHIRKNRFRSKSVMKFWSRSFFLYILILWFAKNFVCKIKRIMKFWKKKIFFKKFDFIRTHSKSKWIK